MNTRIILPAVLLSLSLLASARNKNYVSYEEFGARGNGITDDQAAIVAAHKAANEKGLPVKAKAGHSYYIGGGAEVAIIKTNVDWTGAKFIINDVNAENPKLPVFRVEASQKPYTVEFAGPLKKGQGNLGIKLKEKSLVSVRNKNKKVYIREGLNQNSGAAQQEMLLVNADGSIVSGTEPVWDYECVTEMKVYPIDKERLTVKGGEFTTVANQEESRYKYQKRGIEIARSTVYVENLVHYVEGELDHGAPYNSFLGFFYAEGILVRDCVFTGHKTYVTIGSAKKPVRMGTYDINGNHSINVHLENCRQTNNIDDVTYWGIYTSNYCKNLSLTNCVFSRFDAHQGVANVTLTDCTFGHQGARMVGFGKLTMNNCTSNNEYLISFRPDYGSSWEGDIIIRNCVVKPSKTEQHSIRLITGRNAGTHDFGYECKLPANVTIDGLIVDDSLYAGNKKYTGVYLFGNFEKDAPVNVTMKNVEIKSGKPLKACINHELFKGIEL